MVTPFAISAELPGGYNPEGPGVRPQRVGGGGMPIEALDPYQSLLTRDSLFAKLTGYGHQVDNPYQHNIPVQHNIPNQQFYGQPHRQPPYGQLSNPHPLGRVGPGPAVRVGPPQYHPNRALENETTREGFRFYNHPVLP